MRACCSPARPAMRVVSSSASAAALREVSERLSLYIARLNQVTDAEAAEAISAM